MIKTYFGPMGAAKSKTLLDLYEKIYFKNRILVFTPTKDDRFGVGVIQDRTGRKIEAIAIDDIFEIEKYLTDKTKNIFIDEVNFFESEIDEKRNITLMDLEERRNQSMNYLLELSLKKNINIYLFGLNLTAEKRPYGLMSTAIHYADEREELFAECTDCGDHKAKFTYYIPYEKDTNVIGAADYCALCGSCHLKWTKLYHQLKKEKKLDEYKKKSEVLRTS